MSAATWASRSAARSGGESRADGPADDAYGPLELDPVRVDARVRGGGAGQGADRVVGQQVAPDLLFGHGRGLRAQHLARPAQVRLELLVAGLVLPALVVGLRQLPGRGQRETGEGGDQDDLLVRAVRVPV